METHLVLLLIQVASISREHVERGTIDVLGDDIAHYPQLEDSENVARLYINFIKSQLKPEKSEPGNV